VAQTLKSISTHHKQPGDQGHENVATIRQGWQRVRARKGFKEGRLAFVEHYVSCGKCEWCNRANIGHSKIGLAQQSGIDPLRIYVVRAGAAPWGGLAICFFFRGIPSSTVPKGVSAERAGLVTPMGNGVECRCSTANVGYNSTVLIQARAAGAFAGCSICKRRCRAHHRHGTSKDKVRLEAGESLGADYVINVHEEIRWPRIREITAAKGSRLTGCTRRAARSRSCSASKR